MIKKFEKRWQPQNNRQITYFQISNRRIYHDVQIKCRIPREQGHTHIKPMTKWFSTDCSQKISDLKTELTTNLNDKKDLPSRTRCPRSKKMNMQILQKPQIFAHC